MRVQLPAEKNRAAGSGTQTGSRGPIYRRAKCRGVFSNATTREAWLVDPDQGIAPRMIDPWDIIEGLDCRCCVRGPESFLLGFGTGLVRRPICVGPLDPMVRVLVFSASWLFFCAGRPFCAWI
jgi:hypothetical protein